MFGFVITYSLVRSIIEDPFRVVPLLPKSDPLVDPAVHGWGALTYSQAASIILILIGIWGLSQLKRWNANSNRKRGSESRQVRRAKDRQSGKN
jgi:prolipoprotein diacylglyceryltransferase